MANSTCSRLYTCFHWLTILAICVCFGQGSADCSDIHGSIVIGISEEGTLDQPIFNISATSLIFDPDSHGNQFKDWLDINQTSTGNFEVILKKSFDADVPEAGTKNFTCDKTSNSAGFIEIDLKCSDHSTIYEESIILYLNILDVDEYAPHFEHPDSTVTIPEDQDTGTSVYTLKACDPDSQNLQVVYDIVDYLRGDHGYFNITDSNRYTGQVDLVQELDYDSATTLFVLNISATEVPAEGVGLVSYTTLTINVTDVDDLLPEFIDRRYSLSIPEGDYTRQEWFNTSPPLSARDDDYHINKTIRFRMGQGSQNIGLFSVAENGSIAANGSLQPGTFNILVEAYQTDKPTLRYVTTIVTITATDVNDHEPEMVESFYNATVVESAPVGTMILTVDAVDTDVGNNSVIEFHLSGTGDSLFNVETRGHTGTITLNGTLDREAQANYTFEIWAEETLTKERYSSSKSRIVIFVADVNDNDPVFTSRSYAFNLTRTRLNGEIVGQVSAFDPDAGDNGEVTYTIQFSTLQPSAFTIDNSTGKIKLSRDLEYSDVGVHHLSVSAADNPNTRELRRSTNAQVTVNILPANTKQPEFGNQSYTFKVLETSTPGYLVGKVTATDADRDRVEYSSEDINSYFSLNSTSGEITVNSSLDLDDQQLPAPYPVNFTVNATDGEHNTSTVVTVLVSSVNEFSPKFVLQRPVSVLENATQGTFVAQVSATDRDTGPDGRVTFSLLPSVGSDLFNIDPNTGEISLNCSDCLDPRRGTYDLIVQATDGGSPNFTDTIVVPVKTIFAPPKFTQAVYYVSVKENQTAPFVLQLFVSDDDTPQSEFNFSLDQVIPQTADNEFIMLPNGSVYINGSIDAEVFNYAELNVSVSDGHSSDNARVIVNITDVNEYDPVLNITHLAPIEIPENKSIAEFVAAVGATDDDVTNDGFSYFLSAGADGKFVIDTNTGVITVSGSLDRKLTSEYNITVNVLDHGSPPRLGSGNLTIKVIDSNSAPYFTNGSATVSDYHFSVLENLTVGDLVGSLNASDEDKGSSRELSFRLQPNVLSSYFLLDKDSGKLTLAKSLDYENTTEYNLTVVVSDNSLTPKNATATVTIHVTNIEEAPQWSQPLSTVYVTQSSVCKNQQWQLQALSEEVTTVSSHGDDDVVYSLVNMKQEFSINNTSGLLKINHPLNEGVYHVSLSVCNRNSTVCSDAVLTVIVQNKKTLAFCPAFYTVDVNETAFVNFSFLDLNATEGDARVSYNISAGNTEGKFGIGMNGGLYVAKEFDRGKTRSYTLLISAEDLSSHQLAEAQVIVRILQIHFSAATYHGEILESADIGSPVLLPFTDIPLAVAATGGNENAQLTYSLDTSSDTSNGTFNITMNGTIILAKRIDYEAIPVNLKGTFTITVIATDGTSSSTAMVFVHVQDINDKPPKFIDTANLVLNITEGQTSGQELVQVNATDPDTHTTLVYSIDVIYPTAGAPQVFYIDPSSGMIIILQDLDYENETKYILNVTVSDGTHSINETLTVHVLDVNDNPPIFNQTFNLTVVEGDSGVGTNISVKAFDADSGQNGEVSNYTIISGNVNGSFAFDSNILKTIKALDKESVLPNHGAADIILTIQAVDNGNPALSGTGTVFVTISDIDDNPPQFSQKLYTATVPEDAINVTVVLLLASDVDTPQSELNFSLVQVLPQTAGNEFVVFPNGSVYINGSIDADIFNYFELDVSVSDGHGNDSARVIVNITDVNEYDPVLNISSLIPVPMPENISIAEVVAAIGAKDRDVSNDGFSYFLSAGADGKFVIDTNTGVITVSGSLDCKLKSEYNITVNVFDHGSPPRLGSGNLVVRVKDSNSAPYFTNGSVTVSDYHFNILENLTVGELVGSLNASDEDTGSSGELSYRLQPNILSSYFLLDKDSGKLTLAKSLDDEKTTEYNLTVVVSDNSLTPKNATANVTVHVTNIIEAPQWSQPLTTVHVTQSSVCKNQQWQLQALSEEVTTVSSHGDDDVVYSLVNMTQEFSINNTSGLLKINHALNAGVYHVWLSACNRNSPTVCSRAVQTVIVQNKKILAFCPAFYRVDFNETAFVNFSFLDLNATEADDLVSYNISAGNAEGKFRIGVHDGKLYVAKELESGKTRSYTLLISAEDLSSHDLAEAQVVVSIMGVTANEGLHFSAATYHGEILESQDIGSPVLLPFTDTPLLVAATGGHENLQLTYSIDASSDTSNGSFNITLNGTIISAKEIDYETIPAALNKIYTFTVNATDGIFSRTAKVDIHVQDINDNRPSFADPPDNLVKNITEGKTSGQELVQVNATDPDGHTILVYSIDVIYPTAGAPGVFYIDQSSGKIIILRDLDHEDNDTYIMNVTVSDGKFSNSTTVTVNVLDINDNPPIFNQTFYMTVIEGDSGIGTNISVKAFDADSGQNGDVSNYTIVSGNVNGSFVFDSNVLKTIRALDKESVFHTYGPDLILTVLAVDNGNPSRTGTGTVFVTITDIDDNPPQFSHKRYTAKVPENAINVTVDLTPQLALTDADIDDCPGYQFSLSDNSNPFVVNTSSGILFVAGKLDRETHDNYTLQVIAIDNCGKGLNSSAEIFIQILDVDDEPPKFLESVYNFNISKNAHLRQSVGIVKAKDVDTSGDFIVYRLSGSDLFHIDHTQGEIFLIGDLSSGNITVFSITVSACDSGILDQCGTATVRISVTDICPVWNTTSLELYAKEGETGSLGWISTLHDELSNVTYFLSDTAKWLEISPSGEVILLTQLKADKADKTSFKISVYAEDSSQPNCSLPGTLALTVLGTNDHHPEICYRGRCGDSQIEITVFDGSPENSLVALVATRDNDTGPDGNVTLALTVATSGLEELFSLEATEIILQKQINLTDLTANSTIQNDTIDLILTATDQGQPPLSTNITFRVHVVKAQGDALSFANQTYFLKVEENKISKTFIGTVAVKSPSSTATTLKYYIYAPVGNVPFDIDLKNGAIATSAVLDRETQGYYLFTVVAIHPSQPQVSALALVVVNVTDVNERPVFDNSNITWTAPENKAPVVLGTLTAHDADEGSNGSVTYILASGSPSHFVVNNITGVLSVIQALDRENISSYDLVIEAVDGGSPALSTTIAVHVIVTDQNDHAPNFTQSQYEYNITASVPPVQITKITAIDDDEGLNKDIRYSLQSDLNTFKIDPLSGEIESIAILTKNVYTLVVMAKDQGNPPLNSTANIIIRLTDNRTSIVPYLSLSTHFLSLIVGLKVGTPLNVSIRTKDADSLQISGENGNTVFEIKKGQIVLSQDLTQQKEYVLTITAISTTGQNVSQELVIHVDRLIFSQQSYTAAVMENNIGSQIILDIDSNAENLGIPVIYSLLASYSAFYIESATGILSVRESLDREKISLYVLNVSLAVDPSATPLNGRRRRAALLSDTFASVLVQVEDQNDNVPSFDNLGSSLHLSIPANVNTSYLIKTLKAGDPDEGMNGLIRYTISSGDTSVFDLNPITGELRVASPEKLGNHSTSMLTVVAADRNGTGSNATLDVWINIEQDDDQFRLSIPFSVSVLNRNKEDILKNLSRILGLTFSHIQVMVHEESGNVDPDRSYLLFQAHQQSDNTTLVMSASQIQSQISKHQAEIQKLFKSFESQPQANKKDENGDMNATSISLMVVACVMFVATLVAIFVSCQMWKKQKKYEEKVAQMRLAADVKPKEDDGNKKYTSVNSGDIELTIMSEEPPSTSALSPGTTNSTSNGYLQQVQQSLQELACESADSGLASPVHSDSDTSRQDLPVAVQRNAADEETNDASGSVEDTVESGDGTTELLGEGSGSPLVQEHTYVNVTVENSKDENQIEQHNLESVPAAEDSSDREEASSFTLPSQDSLPAVSSIPPISSSHDALLQNSVPNNLKHQPPTSYNSIAYHSTEPPVASSWTPGLSFLNKAFDSSGQADLDSDIEEAITYF